MRIFSLVAARQGLAALTILSFTIFTCLTPAIAQDEPPPAAAPTLSEIFGTITLADGTVTSARMLLVSMDDPDDAPPRYTIEVPSSGRYEMEGLRHGYYRVGFLVGDQSYVSNRLISLAPKKKTEANFTLGEFTKEDEEIGLRKGSPTPGAATRGATGVARLFEDFSPKGWEWLQTNRGVAVLLGGSTLLIGGLILASDDDDETIVSPVDP